ncbi:hypothetical protein DV735_g5713, partial [Chaetothyriales sp. CBS 134920]
MPQPRVLIIGTTDTKFDEILYIQEKIRDPGNCDALILDVSHTPKRDSRYEAQADSIHAPLVPHASSLAKLARREYIDKTVELSVPVVKEMVSKQQIHGIVSAAGSSGTSIACAIMRRACPLGFPKLMVSTMASGNIKPYIEETDITIMYSIVDISGINSILKRIYANAASAISGMASSYAQFLEPQAATAASKRVGMSVFRATIPVADMVRKTLTATPHDLAGHEVYVFHATGAGGSTMERLVSEGHLDAVIDLTPTEIPDELFGGVLTAGPNRLEAAAKKGIPYLVSLGACDSISFGARETIPEHYLDRNLYSETPTLTLMRTTKENSHQIGKFIAQQLKKNAQDASLIKVIIPEGGISMLDAPGEPFYDPDADKELFNTLEHELEGSGIEVLRFKEHINTEAFASHVCHAILELMNIDPKAYRLANARRRQWSFDHGSSIQKLRRQSYVEIPDAAVS